MKKKEVDIEALAAEKKMERMAKCGAAVDKVLGEHGCYFAVVVQIGNQQHPIEQILNLPVLLTVASRK